MGYEIYITRAPSHLQTTEFPISANEWRDVVEVDDELLYATDHWYDRRAGPGPIERFHPWLYVKHPKSPALWFIDGAVSTKSPDQATIAKMVALATKLDAIVLDENGGSSYGEDGSWKPWGPPATPAAPIRPWWKRLFKA